MKIVYHTITGAKVVRRFDTWFDLCLWLKRYYPFINAADEMGQIWRG